MKESFFEKIELPASTDIKFTDDGDLVLSLVYVSLYTHRLCKLILMKAKTYVDYMSNKKNCQSPKIDLLKLIASKVQRELTLSRLP